MALELDLDLEKRGLAPLKSGFVSHFFGRLLERSYLHAPALPCGTHSCRRSKGEPLAVVTAMTDDLEEKREKRCAQVANRSGLVLLQLPTAVKMQLAVRSRYSSIVRFCISSSPRSDVQRSETSSY